MEAVRFCRVCLNVGVKLYSGDVFQLLQCYEDLIHLSGLKSLKGLQCYFCYECSAILWKINKFKEKCEIGQNVLNNLLFHGEISHSSITNIDRKELRLESTISTSVPSHNVANYEFYENTDENLYNIEKNISTDSVVVKEEHKIEQFCTILTEHNFIDENSESSFKHEDMENISSDADNDHNKIPDGNQDSLHVNFMSKDKTINLSTKTRTKKYCKVIKKAKTTKAVSKSKTSKKSEDTVKRKPVQTPNKRKPRDKYATQRASAYKFDADKWNIVYLTEEEMKAEHEKLSDNANYQNSAHKCLTCIKTFTCEDTLKRHMRVHSEERGQFSCFLCARRFVWATRLRMHLKVHRTVYHCLRCREVFNYATRAIAHDRVHAGLTFQCKHCEAKFTNKSSYYTHVRARHRSDHVCAACGASFVSALGLRQHTLYKHHDGSIQGDVQEAEEAKEDDSTNKNTFCEKCAMSFRSVAAFEEHKKNSKMHLEDNENEKNSLSKIKLYKSGVSTTNNTGEQFTCDQCPSVFFTRTSRELHRTRKHGGGGDRAERYICEICGASLAYGSIKVHKNMHNNVRYRSSKRFPCAQCGKEFQSAWNRTQHMTTHTGEKPFACKLCDKRFTQSQGALKHFRTCH
ncbi:zinc finger protein 184 [Plutella xylostella]|uniref:zinc finger protein 184 n=1 Tax=Plutella xylostella TaxID=51655 RepID=UPI0020325CD9|nr:zinc finger protein 184 [Plutella xylostella]